MFPLRDVVYVVLKQSVVFTGTFYSIINLINKFTKFTKNIY